jgi:hypothetical protein
VLRRFAGVNTGRIGPAGGKFCTFAQCNFA